MGLTQVKTTGLADDAVTSAKIADDAVVTAAIADDAVTGANIADDTVAEANMANDAISLTELKAGTDGQIISWDASGNPVAVGPGTDGQVLTSTGAGSPPAFETISSSDTLSFRNVLCNGAMRVNQKETSKSGVTSSGYHVIDTYRFVDSSIGTWTVSQEDESPTQFSKSYKMACTTANASPGSSSKMRLECRLEGNTLQAFHKGTADAKPLALSFWTKTNEPGVYTVHLQDHDNNRSVAANYTVSSGEASAQTWVKREIVFPADTTGAWDDDNAKSATLEFIFDAGSGFKSGTQNTSWGAASDAVTAAGMTAALGDSTSNVFYITGIQLEPTSVTDFEYRSYADELQRCLRYYWKPVDGTNLFISHGWYYTSSHLSLYLKFPVTMRATPTGTDTTGSSYYRIHRNGGADDFNSVVFETGSNEQYTMYNSSEASGTAGQIGYVQTANASAKIEFSAEL